MSKSFPGRIQRAVSVFVAGVLTFCMAGCSGSRNDNKPESGAPGDTQTLLSSVNLKLPIESYMFTDAQVSELRKAKGVLIAHCMREFGFTYTPMSSLPSRGPRSRMDRRYGLTDMAMAKTDGYHLGARDPRTHPLKLPPMPTGLELKVLVGPERAASKPTSSPPTSASKLYVRGKLVPALGCAGAANSELMGTNSSTDSPGDSNLAQNLNNESFHVTMKNPRVREVFRAWSKCMSEDGYRYADTMAVAADHRFQGKKPTPLEIRVATADVACKKKTNLVGVWFTVETAYQKSLIRKNKAALVDVLRSKKAQLSAATAVNSRVQSDSP